MPQAYDNYGRLKVIRGLPGAIEWFPGDGPALDDFGRQRVSDPETLFSASFEYDSQLILFEKVETTGGSVVHDPTKRVVRLSATSSVGSKAVFQQRQYNQYQPGKAQRFKQTFVLRHAVSGMRKRIGYFDAGNGVFFEQNEDGTLRMVVRSSVSGSVVDTAVSQANWTVDPFDGAGVSGIDINEAYQQILDCSFQWLGAGRVRYGFNIDGLAWYAHYANHANLSGDAPYMQTANLPLRYEIENVSAGSGTFFDIICAEVESEGGTQNPPAYHFSNGNSVTSRTASGTRYPVMSLRPAARYNGITNRSLATIEAIDMTVATNDVLWELIYGGTLTGASWAAADPNSAVEVDVAATAISGGIVALSGYGVSGQGSARAMVGSDVSSKYPFCLDTSGSNPKLWTLAITPVSGNAAIAAMASWNERR